MVTVTAQAFNRNPSSAKRAAGDEPVVITDRGRPAYVLMNFRTYEQMSGQGGSLLEAHALDTDTELETPRVTGTPREVDW